MNKIKVLEILFIAPFPASFKHIELYSSFSDHLVFLERINPGGDKPVSRFAPGVLVKFGWDHDAEVRALQFIHGRLPVPTPRVLHHAPFPANAVVEPWNWVPTELIRPF
jgi:hypothetical protein